MTRSLIFCLSRHIYKAVFLTFLWFVPAFAADGTETAYDRVMRTGTLRCGYILYDPAVQKDQNTKKIHVIPAYAGISRWHEIPACAGMTSQEGS